MKTITVEDVAAGMTADIRDEAPGVTKLAKHFDLITRPKTLTPYHSQITGDGSASLDQITDLFYSNSGLMFGAGVNSGSPARTRVYSNNSFTSASWTNLINGVSASGDMVKGTFVEYHGFGYGFNSNSTVWKVDLSDATPWSDDAAGGALTGVPNGVQGLVHSKDDILYMATANRISLNNNGAWTKNALVLPDRYTITCLAEYGNYLAIGCDTTIAGNSIVYLWDRDTSLNTITENIDWGNGQLRVLQQVEGELLGVSIRQDVNTNLASRLEVRRYFGSTADVFATILASTSVGLQLLQNGQKQNERMYFAAGITIDGVLHNGVWCVGKSEKGHWAVWCDRLPNNDTAIAANSLQGFFIIGDFVYISYNDSGFNLTMTSSVATAYAGSSIIETVINPDMPVIDKKSMKQLQAVQVSYDALPTAGQVILKYKVDGGSFITVFTETADGEVATETGVDATGTSFTSGRDYQFRIECTGGANFCGFKYKYEALKTII